MGDTSSVANSELFVCVESGDIEGAKKLLLEKESTHGLTKFPYLDGEIVHGEKRGRTIGYPTANLGEWDLSQPCPADGVYAGFCTITFTSESKGGERMLW